MRDGNVIRVKFSDLLGFQIDVPVSMTVDGVLELFKIMNAELVWSPQKGIIARPVAS